MKCGDKEWKHCQVEKMGCLGCYYDEIKTGEYVITQNRLVIGKIIKIESNDKILIETKDHINVFIERWNILKHNLKLIEIIKEGDYINGHPIVKIRIDPFNNKKQLFTEHWEYNWQGDGTLLVFYEEDIKFVVTKEQFRSIEYKLRSRGNINGR